MTQATDTLNHSISDRYEPALDIEVEKTGALTRLFKSTVTQTAVGALALYKGCIQPLSSGRLDTTTALISWVALGVLFISKEKNWLKRLVYEITICGVVGWDRLNGSFHWIDEILPASERTGGLALSSQPLKNKGHHLAYRNWAVLSMNERDELSWTSPFTDPVTPEDWKNVSPHREHKILECPDYYLVPTDLIIEAVKWIHDKRMQGIDVLVHCKAGKGRSGTVVICYLLFLKFLEGNLRPPYRLHISEAIREVKEKRAFVASGSQAFWATRLFAEKMSSISAS